MSLSVRLIIGIEAPARRASSACEIPSIEDGRKYKFLKRHLATSHDLTPNEYRTKWGLPKFGGPVGARQVPRLGPKP
ncbi:MucR family transcriptional regulator [Mesorhizobium sp. ES1-3]|uniref:MucR family transcriptional regulator n=1 Tax=Mesorhizobium sp. ES1-3 TaxID=2876628 RepID=UPI00398D1C40